MNLVHDEKVTATSLSMEVYGLTFASPRWCITNMTREHSHPLPVHLKSNLPTVGYPWFLDGVLFRSLDLECTFEEIGFTITYEHLLKNTYPLLPFFVPDVASQRNRYNFQIPFPLSCRGTFFLLKPVIHSSTLFSKLNS
jgi:hypothetical protein